jgi:hypothetical protein
MNKLAKGYIAGKLNADAVGYIQNVHRMIKTAKEVRDAGFAVYVPCNDFLEGVVCGNFDYADYFDNSQPWLAASDFVFLTPGWETSKGTAREIELAKTMGIPVFDNLDDLVRAFSQNQ